MPSDRLLLLLAAAGARALPPPPANATRLAGRQLQASLAQQQKAFEFHVLMCNKGRCDNNPMMRRMLFNRGVNYLKCRQTSSNNRGVVMVRLTHTGEPREGRPPLGLGSLLQFAAKDFNDALMESPHPIDMVGHLGNFTRSSQCPQIVRNNNGHPAGIRCWFQPLVINKLLHVGCEDGCPCDELDPGWKLRGMNWDSPWWFGVVLSHLAQRFDDRFSRLVERTQHESGATLEHPDIAIYIGGDEDAVDPYGGRRRPKARRKVPVSAYLEVALSWVKEITAAYTARVPGGSRVGLRKVEVFVGFGRTDYEVVRAIDAEVRQWAGNHSQAEHFALRMQRLPLAGPAEIGAEAYEFKANEMAILDLNRMSHASALAGLCMSAWARMAVTVGVAKGTMRDVVALDPEFISIRDEIKFGQEERWRSRHSPARITWEQIMERDRWLPPKGRASGAPSARRLRPRMER